VSLKINKELVILKSGEYASIYYAMKNLVYPKLETGRYDEKYFKDETNDQPSICVKIPGGYAILQVSGLEVKRIKIINNIHSRIITP
jgi:hypothetical protein